MTDWDALARDAKYEEVAHALIVEQGGLDLHALGADPLAVLDGFDGLVIEVGDPMGERCAGGGYYRPAPPTIYLHPAIRRRDNFTLLHEFGHHLQRRHPDWNFALMALHRREAVRVEEEVSNQVAVQILMPWKGEKLDARDVHPADVMAGLYATTSASRSAVVQRVRKLLPDSAKWILVAADVNGRVQHAVSTYTDFQPAKESLQPGFAALAGEAQAGRVRRPFSEGLRYRNGSELHEMNAEAVIDHEGRYVFIALTPTARFGSGKQEWPVFECSSLSCERTFRANMVNRHCKSCEGPVCPHCGRCACEIAAARRVCSECHLEWTAGEIAAGEHECW